MTLTYELDLDILPLDLHAKIQVCTSVRLGFIARRTDGHTDTQTQDVKTITPDTSETWGVKKTAYALKTPHVVFLPVLFISFFLVHRQGSQKSIEHPNEHFLTS